MIGNNLEDEENSLNKKSEELSIEEMGTTGKKSFFSSFYQSLALSQLCITLFHSSHLFCFTTTADGIIKNITRNIEKIIGYYPEEVIGKNGVFFLHRKDFISGYRFFRKSQRQQKGEWCIVRIQDHNKQWLRVKLFPVWNEQSVDNPYFVGLLLS